MYLTKIEIAPARHVHLDWHDERLCALLPEYQPWEALPALGLIALESTQRWEGGLRRYNTQVEARLRCATKCYGKGHLARLTAADGTQYLVGLPDAPSPLFTFSEMRPDSTSEKVVFSLHISCSLPPLRIL